MPVAKDQGRKQFVGLERRRRRERRCRPARMSSTGAGAARRSQGYVTSSYMSPSARPAGRARPRRGRARAHGRDGRRLSSRRRAARDHRARRRARSGRKAAPCVRRDWPPARGRPGLAHRPAAPAGAGARRARPDADLGRSRSGGRRARARRADRSASMRSRRRARMRCASAATSALLVTPAPLAAADGWRDGWCATARRRRLGGGRGLGRRRAAGAHAGDLGRPRRRLALGRCACSSACAACWRGRKRASACMSRRRGWRRCSPGSTAFEVSCSLVESRRPLVLRSAGGASRRTLQGPAPAGSSFETRGFASPSG